MARATTAATLLRMTIIMSMIKFWRPCCSSSAAPISEDMVEANARLDFKRGITSDPYGKLTSWAIDGAAAINKSSTSGIIHPCAAPSWIGIFCDAQKQHVIAIDLASSNLSGSIAPSLALLPALSALNLSDNFLHGGIPSSLFGLPRSPLLRLNLSMNLLNESLPESVGNLSSLQMLDLSVNHFAGEIPRSLGEWKSLKELYLVETGMTGTIPSEIWQLPALTVLEIAGDDSVLEATMPQEFASCSTIRAFALDKVLAKGSPFPASLSTCKRLEFLLLSVVGLEGFIPAEFWQLPLLQFLAIADSEVIDAIASSGAKETRERPFKLHGSLPVSFRSCPTIAVLVVDGVNLTGNIPSSLGQCPSLEQISLSHGSLQGDIPKTLGNRNLEILFFQSQNLTGTIPKELFQGPALAAIKLGDNPGLTGAIPSEVGGLKQLQHLSLFTTSLWGPVPEELCNCTQLQWLDLGWQRLARGVGKIPDCIAKLAELDTLAWQFNEINAQVPMIALRNLTQLEYLDLSWTSLKGQIPAELGNMSNLQTLGLRHNILTGPIPSELARAPLQKLDLAINQLNGSISEALVLGLANGSSIKALLLSVNRLQGVIPSSIGQLHNLQLLYVDQNQLRGEIPPTLANATALQDLVLHSNQLEGTIPASLGRLTTLSQNLVLAGNRLHGEIPVELGALTNLKVLDLSKNQLSGHVPTAALENCTSLETLRISENKLSGKIEQLDFLKMLNLKTFTLQRNSLQGALPGNLTRSKNLVLMDVQRNALSGNLPSPEQDFNSNILGLTNLRVLVLSHNRLSGEIPGWVWKLPMLQVLDLSNNRFHGRMPTTVTHLTYFKQSQSSNQTTLYEEVPQEIKGSFQVLTYILNARISFDLSRNDLEGDIAESFGELVGLLDLDLSNNRIGGRMPESLGKLMKLEELDLSHNQLSGSIPEAIAELGGLSLVDLSYNQLQGPIPAVDNFQTRFNFTRFQGNAGLCGPPLRQQCPSTKIQSSLPTTVANSNRSFLAQISRYVSPWAFLIGYPVGLVVAFYSISRF